MPYIHRHIIDIMLPRMRQEQAIVLTGARQTGKTTLCECLLPRHLKRPFTYISFDDPDERLRFQTSAIAILEALETPLVILDEVQKIPFLFDPLKYVIDKQRRGAKKPKRLFILTGSSQLTLLKSIKETLAGRVALLNLYPFSLSEVLESSNLPLLTKIWTGQGLTEKDRQAFYALSPEKVRLVIKARDEHQTWGGYPSVWQRKERPDKLNWLKDYRKTYLERDISDVGQVANIDSFALAQKLLCARTAQILSLSEVARDLSVAVNTVKRYINLLTMSFQCYLLPPYYENVGKRFIKSPKIFFPDPGLNRVILGEMGVSSGASYESWVFSELIKWKELQAVEPDLFFYRTGGGMEIDFLIRGEEITLPVEVKASNKVTPADGRSLELFMDKHKSVSPLGVIVYRGRELAEIRKNIWAVPDWFLFAGL
ncbi:MAG: ATP-binding protein [Thermodesulfobacteriota bacterium]